MNGRGYCDEWLIVIMLTIISYRSSSAGSFLSFLWQGVCPVSSVNFTMKKYILSLVSVCLLHAASAQLKGFSVGAYAEYAAPTCALDESNKKGMGAGLNADVRLGKIGLTGSVGFIHFGGRSVTSENRHTNFPAINAVPMRAGLKYRIIPLLYLKVESGVVNYTNGNGSAVIFSPGLGIRVMGLDVQAKHESWIKDGSRSFWGLKVGYNF